MVRRIACFFTCGHTESGAMQSFLQKINDNYVFRQCLPNKPKRKQGRTDVSLVAEGATGSSLHREVYRILRMNRDEYRHYSAIMIEDDLDNRFSGMNDDQISAYKSEITMKVRENVDVEQMPVIFLYASPEVEAWFLADWNNSFFQVYTDRGIINDVSQTKALDYYVHCLKRYIDANLVDTTKDDIEAYGEQTMGESDKLSARLQQIVRDEVKQYIREQSDSDDTFFDELYSSKKLYYSKRIHGTEMLRRIVPENVAGKCRRFFFDAYMDLRNL